MRTYCILIETQVGATANVLDSITAFEEVRSVDHVTGPSLFDIVAKVETDDVEALGSLVQDGIDSLIGVRRTNVCVVAPEYLAWPT
ncbi:Lrp/AsnC ligand binding domain-containing protein [Chloroflexota bacterium]